MSKTKKKSKKKPSGGKYKVRRFFLTLFLCALVAAGGWFAYEHLDDLTIPTFAFAEESSQAEEPSQAEPPPEEEPDPAMVSVPDWEIILVNRDNPMPEGYMPELEMITDNCLVDKRIADNVKLMFADAKASGINLVLSSAYRSIERQRENFESKTLEHMSSGKTRDEAVAATSRLIARPGESEHHTGLALDILSTTYRSMDRGFEKTPAFAWLEENAHKYGFIMRYAEDKQNITNTDYEPWHYRYVGEENAEVIKGSGLCLEEYVAVLKGPSVLLENPQHEDEAVVGEQSIEEEAASQAESGEESVN